MNKAVRREMEVAFSKEAQPIWFRILKYIVLATIIYFLWGSKWLWPVLGILTALAISLHFWYRHKTKGWKQDYGMWKVEKRKKSPQEDKG
jgi:hypothetical protein